MRGLITEFSKQREAKDCWYQIAYAQLCEAEILFYYISTPTGFLCPAFLTLIPV